MDPVVAKEANHYVSGSFYANLEVQALAYRDRDKKMDVSIFVDNSSSLNGVSEELVKALKLEVQVDEGQVTKVDLDLYQKVQRPHRTTEIHLEVPGFTPMTSRFQVMPIPEQIDVLMGMIWLREQNPEIDWKSLTLKPRAVSTETQLPLKSPAARPARLVANNRRARQRQSRETFNFYRQHGHDGRHGNT